MQELTFTFVHLVLALHLNHQLNFHSTNAYYFGNFQAFNLTLDLILIKTKIQRFLLKESHN